MDFCRDAATGLINVGLRRFMLHGRATTGIDLIAPSDLRNIYLAALGRGERLPLSVIVGGHPVDYFGATMRAPGDELALLACLRASPMPVVKCVTNDQRVPEFPAAGYLAILELECGADPGACPLEGRDQAGGEATDERQRG